jgi:AcrR family transcriptional regulator
LTKKEIQKRRMMSYFIEAAANIIEEEGIQGITTRKVADLAGYNVATVYNYFKNLDHLIFFASLKFIKDYVLNLSSYTKYASNALEKSILIWECFCKYSFKKPDI